MGGFGLSGYTLVVEDENTGLEVSSQHVTGAGAVVDSLRAGEYRVWVYDEVGCYSFNHQGN